MRVGDLIEYLMQYPNNQRVVVNGYEGGYDDIEVYPFPTTVNIVEEEKPYWWWGKYDTRVQCPKGKPFDAVFIGRDVSRE